MAKPPHKLRWLAFLGLALLALAVRLPRLAERPMHTDESVHAYIVGEVLKDGIYHYDPADRHGPALYAVAVVIAKIAGIHDFANFQTEPILRHGPAIFGALTVLLTVLLVNQIGFGAALTAALFFAIGPLPVYYSRYFIHETLFVAATLCLLATGWRVLTKPSPAHGILAGLCAGVMLACKETALLHFAAFGIAGLFCFIAARRAGENKPELSRLLKCCGAGLVTLIFVTVLFYTWAGHDWHGPVDLVKSFSRYAARAGGEGHEKPFWYYLVLLDDGWSGWAMLLLALIGVFVAIRQKTFDVQRFILVYAIAVVVAYSAIPYKMPWLALNLWLPLALLAGCGCMALGQIAKPFVWVCIAGMIVPLAHDTRQRVFQMSWDERNPYAYAHTGEDILRLPQFMDKLAGNKPKSELRIAVVAKDPWPVPWYLRKYPTIGYRQPGENPAPDPADVYITSPESAEGLGARLQNRRPEFFGQRPEVLLIIWPPPDGAP